MPGDFVDLGAGSGKALVAAGLLLPWLSAAASSTAAEPACTSASPLPPTAAAEGSAVCMRWRSLRGVENSRSVHAASLAVGDAWSASGHASALELTLGDIADVDLAGATLVLATSTGFSDSLLDCIGRKAEAVPPGGWLVTLTRPVPQAAARGWDLLEARRRTVSWGAATVFLHRRRPAAAGVPRCTRSLIAGRALEEEGGREVARYTSQVWFHCRACQLTEASGVCAVCAATCHSGCAGVEFAAHSPFFCDCQGSPACCSCHFPGSRGPFVASAPGEGMR